MNKKHYLYISSLLIATFVLPTVTHATVTDFDPKAGDKTGLIKTELHTGLALGQVSPTEVAFDLINTALTLLGTVCVILLIYGGFIWVWARGNQEEVQRAKEILQGTIIGLLIVLASLGIARFVFTTVGDITGATVETVDSADEG